MPSILGSLFHKVVNTTSIPIGVEGGGWWGITKWWDPLIQSFLWPAGPNSGCFPMPSLTSQSCSDSLPAVCLAQQVGAIYRPPEHQWMPDRPVNVASVKADH